jgi:hypothetical protein
MSEIYKTPLQQSKALLYPKPELNTNFYSNSFKDGYKIKGNQAKLGKGRMNYLIEEYGVWDDDSDYAQAYLGYVNPKEFINGTITENDTVTRRELDNPQDLDIDRINNERQTPFLDIDFDNNEIVGHEGRHRMSSLAKAGVELIPVVFRDRSGSFIRYKARPKTYNGQMGGQRFGSGRAKGMNLATDLIPLNYKNIERLYKMFGE